MSFLCELGYLKILNPCFGPLRQRDLLVIFYYIEESGDQLLKTSMDWVVQASAWEVAELGEEDNSHFNLLSGSSSLVGGKNGGGLLNDLRLGRLGEMEDGSMDIIKEQEGLRSPLLPSEMKKTHELSCVKMVLCLVDGCSSDLSKCREYHRRHRVCERHSKTPVVIIKGREQRFCQQCSR